MYMLLKTIIEKHSGLFSSFFSIIRPYGFPSFIILKIIQLDAIINHFHGILIVIIIGVSTCIYKNFNMSYGVYLTTNKYLINYLYWHKQLKKSRKQASKYIEQIITKYPILELLRFNLI